MKIFLEFLSKSKAIRLSIALSMFSLVTILALSFGFSLVVQAKHGCFNKIFSTFVEEVTKE